jgi:hypothetical protein
MSAWRPSASIARIRLPVPAMGCALWVNPEPVWRSRTKIVRSRGTATSMGNASSRSEEPGASIRTTSVPVRASILARAHPTRGSARRPRIVTAPRPRYAAWMVGVPCITDDAGRWPTNIVVRAGSVERSVPARIRALPASLRERHIARRASPAKSLVSAACGSTVRSTSAGAMRLPPRTVRSPSSARNSVAVSPSFSPIVLGRGADRSARSQPSQPGCHAWRRATARMIGAV